MQADGQIVKTRRASTPGDERLDDEEQKEKAYARIADNPIFNENLADLQGIMTEFE